MLRTFKQHQVRKTVEAPAMWEFSKIPNLHDQFSPDQLSQKTNSTMLVPSAWEQTPGMENYRGRAWYRTSLENCEGLRTRVVFGGVSHTATVWIDGVIEGKHYDAYSPFSVLAPAPVGSKHEMVVEVDNSFGDHSGLHIPGNDYYTYGGITRPVEIQYVPSVFIERIQVVTERTDDDQWDISCNIILNNTEKKPECRDLIISIAGKSIAIKNSDITPGECVISEKIRNLSVCPWNCNEPRLYEMHVKLLEHGSCVDDLIERIGFREISVKDGELKVNGEAVLLKGYNRHEDHPNFGCALPIQLMFKDLSLMKNQGCNFVRTSHYPNDQRFLDLCDEMGLYVWEESHARQTGFNHPKFNEQIKQSTSEMITWHFNHPSIIMWGCLNECASNSEAGRAVYSTVIGQIKEMDSSRPVTFASDKREDDLCLDLVDIVSWNLYDAWYAGGTDNITPALEKLLSWLDSPKSGAKGKPIIMSEFGAGAIYGNRQPCCSKWSEEYQATVIDKSLQVYLNHPRIVGAAIWQFCDVRICNERFKDRPRTMNNKGLVDEYRRPKLAFSVISNHFKTRAK